MLQILKNIGTTVLKFITGTAQRLLILLSLMIAVMCCISFIYGLLYHSEFYVVSSVVGGAVFTWINKQT